MASRTKSNPFSKTYPNNGVTGKPTWNTSLGDQDLASFTHGHHRLDNVHVQNGHSRPTTDHRTYSNDPKKVHQWMIDSATGSQSSTDIGFHVPHVAHGHDFSHPGVTLSDQFSAMQSSISEVSLSSHVSMLGFHDPRASSDIACTASARDAMTMATYGDFPLEPDFISTRYSTDENSGYDTWAAAETQSYVIPSSVDMVYSTSAELHHGYMDYNGDSWLRSHWPEAQYQTLEHDHALPFPSNQTVVSPLAAVAMERSISSFSQNSFFVPHTGSPQSSTTQEEPLSVELKGFLDDDYSVPPLNMDGTSTLPPSYNFCAGESDTSSILKTPQMFQQAPLSNMALWSSSDIPNHSNVANHFGDTYLQRRMSGDGEVSNARQHELYQVGTQEDGLYHCPFEVNEGCTHKAEKLKCNYDKHLDSHLKPYRCKVSSCIAVPFSSTACLLRHEREAHGMHGHGEKPYMCTYEDCDRSNVGNGFPRRWNLRDHMKRVHDYTAPPSSTGSTSPTPSSASSQYHGKAALALRKRRTSNNSQASASKRTKATPTVNKATSKPPKTNLASQVQKRQQTMQKQWNERHAALKERVAVLDPTDTSGYELIRKDHEALSSLGEEIRRMNTDKFLIKSE